MAWRAGTKNCCAFVWPHIRLCLREVLCPSTHSFDPESPERDKDRYEAVQSLLSNIMTVSTLLLGFIITGTMISVDLTGEENFGARLLLPFLRYTLLATVSALVSVAMAFRVAQALTTSFQVSTDSALRTLRRNALCVALAELLLYCSLLFFLASIPIFLKMKELGPKICPTMDIPCGDRCSYNDISNAKVHEDALCSALGAELFRVAKKECRSAERSRSQTLCQYFDKYVEGNPANFTDRMNQASWFAWDRSPIEIMDLAVDESSVVSYWQTTTSEAIALSCSVDEAADLKEAACAGPLDTQAKRQVCASAGNYAFLAADCADSKADDADRCMKVCSWVAVKQPNRWGVPPAFVIARWCLYYTWTAFALIACLVSIRMVCPLVESLLVCVDELRKCMRIDPGMSDEPRNDSEDV